MNYTGTIIEESLLDRSVLTQIKILSQKIEPITPRHQTPWVQQWTLDKVEVPETAAANTADLISQSLDSNHTHSWYADFKNATNHYIIFPHKVFLIDRTNRIDYQAATQYAISLGIPDYQVDFEKNTITQ